MTVYKLSLSDVQAERLAGYLARTAGQVDSRVADEIRAQIPKPAVEEPPFGSIVRAPWSGKDHQWVGLWRGWQSDAGVVTDWSQLADVEVLRVGVGEPETERQKAARDHSYNLGAEDFAAKVRRELSAQAAEVITGPEKRCYRDALAVVAALLGEG